MLQHRAEVQTSKSPGNADMRIHFGGNNERLQSVGVNLLREAPSTAQTTLKWW